MYGNSHVYTLTRYSKTDDIDALLILHIVQLLLTWPTPLRGTLYYTLLHFITLYYTLLLSITLYYTLLHFIASIFFEFSLCFHRFTLYYTLVITLCFTGFCKRLYFSKLVFIDNP